MYIRMSLAERRRAFEVFLRLNEPNALPTEEPTVYMKFSNDAAAPLVRLSREDVLAECECGTLDKEAVLIRRLLHQMSTYDCRRQRIIALVFDPSTVLSEVLRCP